MSRLLALIVLAVASLSTLAEAANADKKLKYDASRPLLTLHTPPKRQHPLGALDSLLRGSVGSSGAVALPVVVYLLVAGPNLLNYGMRNLLAGWVRELADAPGGTQRRHLLGQCVAIALVAGGAVAAGIALQGGELVLQQLPAVMKQPADEGRLAVVDGAGGGETKQVHQK